MRRLPRGDEGSTIPLILGFVLIALLVVAGSVAASDAFVQQRDLQDVCDGAAVAAASSADLAAGRSGVSTGGALPLANVEAAAEDYLARDADRRGVHVVATVAPDHVTVQTACEQRTPLAFGNFFGLSNGVDHRATSTARAPLTA